MEGAQKALASGRISSFEVSEYYEKDEEGRHDQER
jgi:hypothetical protein